MTEKRIATPKRACPYTFQLAREAPKEEGKLGKLIVNASPCLGVACQHWIHDEAGPEYGNCATVLTGIFMAEAANQSATAADVARQSQEQAAKAANAANAALASFNAVFTTALQSVTAAVERLAEIVEADDEDEDTTPVGR